MKIDILTLFPELFTPFLEKGLMRRALEKSIVRVSVHQLRDYCINPQGQVDDTPFGGGSGMILRPEPAFSAITNLKQYNPKAKVIYFSPRGKKFDQKIAQDLAEFKDNLILLCGRYEGIDERIIEEMVDWELSMGDYVLMGGEIPAMALLETTTRLLPGVLNNQNSIKEESFSKYMLEYPLYTKPREINEKKVPKILLSGNHSEIAKWRKKRAEEITIKRRPDLLASKRPTAPFYVALIHYPVVDRKDKIIASSITNIDLHDIARSAKTYGVSNFFSNHPAATMRALSRKILDHWKTGYGKTYNPNRSKALEIIRIVKTFDDILMAIEGETGEIPLIISSSAKDSPDCIDYDTMRAILATSPKPNLLLLGTGWGLAPELMEKAHYRLKPIKGPSTWNHLSVRAAAAILLDRLFSHCD